MHGGRHHGFGLGVLIASQIAAFTAIRSPLLIALTVAISHIGAIRARADDLQFPQIVRSHYEAKDQAAGGQFHLWMEREKVSYGLDPRLYPGARMVDITQVTPTPGSPTLTYVEVVTVASQVPEYIFVTGNVRFRLSGMLLKSSNFPAGGGMTPR